MCLPLIGLMALASCSDADLYSALGGEPILPDRVSLTGELCTENTTGDRFPVKVLFVIDSSLDMFSVDPAGARFDNPAGGVSSIVNRNLLQPHVRFGFVGMANSTTAYPTPNGQRFFEPQAPEVTEALAALRTPLGNRRDVINALDRVSAFIFADIAASSPGEILRSRYLVTMLFAGPPTSAGGTTNLALALAQQAERLAERVYDAGVLEFRINTGLAYFGPRTLDLGTDNFNCYRANPDATACLCDGGVAGDANFCSAYCSLTAAGAPDYEADVVNAEAAYKAIAFATGGTYRLFPCPANINLSVDIASAGVELVKKDIVAFNRNVRLTPDGPVIDSDGDGMSDIEEENASPATDPFSADTDGDGLSDRVEFRTVPRQNPLDPTDRPASCMSPDIFGTIPDRDIDLLNDCEEGLLQSSPTIPDTDGDGLPDSLEFWSGMIPISAEDRLLDFDSDGVPNAEEVLAHTDPRSFDGLQRGREAYRNKIVDLGRRKVATLAPVPQLPGLRFLRSSPNVVGGPAFLEWDGCDSTLSFSDARWPVGQPPYEPEPTTIEESGTYTLRARAPNGEEIWGEIEVVKEFLPPCESGVVRAAPLMSVSDRNCYDIQISNIKVMQTAPANGRTEGGLNEILVFFTQAPAGRITSPGVTKVAQINVTYTCEDPEAQLGCRREPSGRSILLTDDMFVTALP